MPQQDLVDRPGIEVDAVGDVRQAIEPAQGGAGMGVMQDRVAPEEAQARLGQRPREQAGHKEQQRRPSQRGRPGQRIAVQIKAAARRERHQQPEIQLAGKRRHAGRGQHMQQRARRKHRRPEVPPTEQPGQAGHQHQHVALEFVGNRPHRAIEEGVGRTGEHRRGHDQFQPGQAGDEAAPPELVEIIRPAVERPDDERAEQRRGDEAGIDAQHPARDEAPDLRPAHPALDDQEAAQDEEAVDGQLAEREGAEQPGQPLVAAVAVLQLGGVGDDHQRRKHEAQQIEIVPMSLALHLNSPEASITGDSIARPHPSIVAIREETKNDKKFKNPLNTM